MLFGLTVFQHCTLGLFLEMFLALYPNAELLFITENVHLNTHHFKQKNRKTYFFMWPPLSHKKASPLPQNCSLAPFTSSGGGLSGWPWMTGNSDQGPSRRNRSSLPWTTCSRGRKLTLTLTPTSKDILIFLSICPKTLWCPPHRREGKSGSYPSTSWKRWGEKISPLPSSRVWEIFLASLSWLQAQSTGTIITPSFPERPYDAILLNC